MTSVIHDNGHFSLEHDGGNLFQIQSKSSEIVAEVDIEQPDARKQLLALVQRFRICEVKVQNYLHEQGLLQVDGEAVRRQVMRVYQTRQWTGGEPWINDWAKVHAMVEGSQQ